MKRINIVCITLLMILLGVNTSCADYLDKAPDEDLTLDDVFTQKPNVTILIIAKPQDTGRNMYGKMY